VKNFSLSELEEELERLKARKSVVAINLISTIDRQINGVNELLESMRDHGSTDPSPEAVERVSNEAAKRREDIQSMAADVVNRVDAREKYRRRRFNLLWNISVVVMIAVIIVFFWLVTVKGFAD
jgi:t-SNARE complex subunit (syntaxin)